MRFGTEPVEGMTLGEWWAIADEVNGRIEGLLADRWDQEVARARTDQRGTIAMPCSCGIYGPGHRCPAHPPERLR